jgi:hypothetical protein
VLLGVETPSVHVPDCAVGFFLEKRGPTESAENIFPFLPVADIGNIGHCFFAFRFASLAATASRAISSSQFFLGHVTPLNVKMMEC